jgi:hypothetical protein
MEVKPCSWQNSADPARQSLTDVKQRHFSGWQVRKRNEKA